MAGNSIDVEAKERMLTIQVRNMIMMDSKAKDMLEIQPLLFKLEVPLALAGNGSEGEGEMRKGLQEAWKKKAYARLESEVKKIVAKAQHRINDEVKKLGEDIRYELAKDQKDDRSAYQDAVKRVENAVDLLDDIVDGLPPSVREAAKEVIKQYDSVFAKQKLTSVGSWGFRDSKGIRVRPGKFKHVTKDNDDDRELVKALDAAKSTSYEFVFVEKGEGGLVLRRRVAGKDTRLAREQSDGGRPLYGNVKVESGVYHFELDKECSQKPEKLAKKIRAIVKERCNRNIKVKVSDDDLDVDDEPAAKGGAAAEAKK